MANVNSHMLSKVVSKLRELNVQLHWKLPAWWCPCCRIPIQTEDAASAAVSQRGGRSWGGLVDDVTGH